MNRFHHLVVVQSFCGRQFHLPTSLITLAYFGIIHRLVTRQHVRHGPMVARSLHIVVPAQRISARARSHVVAGDQQQVGDSRGGIRTLAMLSYSHCPEDAHPFGFRDHLGNSFESLLGHDRNTGGGFHSERLKALSIIGQSIDPSIEELGISEVVVN